MANQPSKPSNVVIVDPETDEVETSSDATPPVEHVQNLKEGYTMFPIPTESAGKGKKYCPNCNGIMAARAVDCPHCQFHIYPGVPKVKATTGTRKPRSTSGAAPAPAPAKPDIMTVYKLLKGRNFEIAVSVDALSDNPEPIVNVGKELKPLVDIIQSGECELISTNPSVKFAISLDQMLKLLGIKERH